MAPARSLTDLGGVPPPGHVLGAHRLLDAVHLLLVALAVARGVLLGLLQRRLQGLDPLGRGAETLFQFRKLTAQVRVITHQLRDKDTHTHTHTFESYAGGEDTGSTPGMATFS